MANEALAAVHVGVPATLQEQGHCAAVTVGAVMKGLPAGAVYPSGHAV